MNSLPDHSAFDSFWGDAVDTRHEHVAGGIYDLDMLTSPGAQRSRKVTSILALNHDARTIDPRKERRHYITLNVSYTATWAPPLITGQPLASFVALSSDGASMML